MSITFTINNDNDKSLVEEFDCQCLYSSDDGETPSGDCHECKGAGIVRFESSNWAMNLANSNASMLLKGLGIDFDYSGKISTKTILERMATLNFDLFTEYWVDSFTELKRITLEAVARDQDIIWG